MTRAQRQWHARAWLLLSILLTFAVTSALIRRAAQPQAAVRQGRSS